jgi:hypothetical protein
LRKLNSYKRNIVPLSHNTGSLAENLKAFPLIRQWLYKQIRKGYISKDALNLINTLIEE